MVGIKKTAYENLLSAVDRAFEQIERKEGPEDGVAVSYWRRVLVYRDTYVAKHYPRLHRAFREQFGKRYARHAIGLEAIL